MMERRGYFEGYIEKAAASSRTRWSDAITAMETKTVNGEDWTDTDLAEAVQCQAVDRWWTSANDAVEHEELDGGTALIRTRQEARRFLIGSPSLQHSGIFGHAMAEAARSGAKTFLSVTDEVAAGMERVMARGES